ncbi:TetR/AcrR family transcriptional regulator [Aestuariibacter salexigens]|uniref:TetR/AcrR family transcriptional regulator n=1 Tax=Aestuariibacter salexigens TaxID=226010 RepID=UPI00047B17FC|nr:TetR/AcrR family transcriptional regulator [Aestuariibacter salexigens]
MSIKTKEAILNAAELLFSQHGFADTSLRMITSDANVNLASVNYHFGNKKNLIQAVLQRYLDVLIPHVEQQLERLEKRSVTSILNCVLEPVARLNDVRPNGTAMFVQLLGRGYTESQGHLRRFIMGQYGDTISRLVASLHEALPDVPAEEMFWRLHFALGTFVFSMASSQALTDIAQADFNQQVDIEGVIAHLAPFVASGISQA